MRYSQLLIPTVKEVPAEAEIPSHQLMIRAGFIRKLASGTYTYLPLGWRCLLKIIQIVREEMNAAGAQEILMPILQPMELWQQTGRDVDYGQTMCRFQDRHGRENALAPTAEEVVTSLVAGEVSSYKQLPINLYQIHDKFRDEFRPRFGVLRSREFIMKDAYSFHADAASLEETYRRMYEAYCRIFTRAGLKYVTVEADSGPIGGSASHEFVVPCAAGEDVIVHTEDFSYAANIEKADVDPPAGTDTREQGTTGNAVLPMEEVHTPGVGSIEAVCAFLNAKPAEMIKTLIYWRPDLDIVAQLNEAKEKISQLEFQLKHEKFTLEGAIEDVERGYQTDVFAEAADVSTHERELEELKWEVGSLYRKITFVIAVTRGDHEVNIAKASRVAGGHIEMAFPDMIEWLTGAAVGFAGPVDASKRLLGKVIEGPRGMKVKFQEKGLVLIDPSVPTMPSGVTGANKTDYHVRNVVPGRDFPLAGDNVVVADIRNAVEGDTHQGRKLLFSRGIEVGHVFKLGTKYSEKLGATFLDEQGRRLPCIMGCYGIGINRILASAIEIGHDENGCILPAGIAPFEVEIVPLNCDKPAVMDEARRIYDELRAAGIDVLIDDRDARPGVKFKDADLLGIPLRVVVGEKSLKDGNVEIKRRTEPKPTLVSAASAVQKTQDILAQMRNELAPKQRC